MCRSYIMYRRTYQNVPTRKESMARRVGAHGNLRRRCSSGGQVPSGICFCQAVVCVYLCMYLKKKKMRHGRQETLLMPPPPLPCWLPLATGPLPCFVSSYIICSRKYILYPCTYTYISCFPRMDGCYTRRFLFLSVRGDVRCVYRVFLAIPKITLEAQKVAASCI